VAIPEAQFLPDCVDATARGEIGATEKKVFEWISGHRRFRLWDLAPDPAPLSSEEDSQAIAKVTRWLVSQWATHTGTSHPAVWVDHTPTHLRRAETLLELFPDAVFLHLVRDGRGVAASLMPLPWGPCDPSSAALFWARSLADGLALEARHPDLVLRVHFEDLVTRTQETLERICGFVQLDFHHRMLKADGFQVPRRKRSQHQLIGGPVLASRASAWRNSLAHREVEIFESQCLGLLSSLGYELQVPGARPPTRWERLRFSLRDLFRRRLVFPIRRRLLH
jgi:hypothetical protein